MSLSHCGMSKVVEFLLLLISPCLPQILRFSAAELSVLLWNKLSRELASSWGPLILGEAELKSLPPEMVSGVLSCGLWPDTSPATPQQARQGDTWSEQRKPEEKLKSATGMGQTRSRAQLG